MRTKRRYGGRYMNAKPNRPRHDLHIRIDGAIALVLDQWVRESGRTVGQEIERLVREELDRQSANPLGQLSVPDPFDWCKDPP